ncbi:hypothetical protein REPUB_Repub07fG0035900 [Reevesia pubescens]
MFPYLSWLDVITGLIPSLKAVFGELDTLMDQIIEEHRDMKSHDNITSEDIFSIILRLQNDGMLEIDLTQDNIKAILLDMLIGGTDTTSTTIEWLMAELLKHPNVMKKVQEEVRNVVGKKSKVDVDDRDPNWWEKPEEFILERFENNPIDFKGQDFEFIPFGFGRRGCPGMSFAIASIEYVIANFLYWFDWELAAGEIAENLDMSEQYGLTVIKKVHLQVLPVSHFFI